MANFLLPMVFYGFKLFNEFNFYSILFSLFPLVAELYFVVNSQKVKGKFYLSNFRFYFKSDEPQKPKDNQTTSVLSEPTTSISTVYVHLILDVPLGLIQRIEKLYFYNNTNQLNEFIGLLIDCKVRSFILFYFSFY